MTRFQTPQTDRPWWAEVEHLRERTGDSPVAAAPRHAPATEAPAARTRTRTHVATQSPPRSRGQRPDWFAEEAQLAGRRQVPRPAQRGPVRPRAKLVDVAPNHVVGSRAQQVRRQPGERPTVTITGRPDGALPPQPHQLLPVRAARTREHMSGLVSSPDRMMLWAVALGLLMIVASVGTAGA